MGGFGFGTIARARKRAQSSPQVPIVTIPVVLPSASWTGTAGSGFTTPPVDPARTTAKPAMRLMVPSNQYFTDELLVGVIAGANNGGTLIDKMGLEKVVLHFEGAAVDITAPSFATFNNANGQPVTYYGWWAMLKKPAATAGHARIYFEAIPMSPSMQRRVIGPYQFSPSATLYDADLTVTPSLTEVAGSRYQSVTNALSYIRTSGKQNTRITITEAHPSGWYDITYTGAYQSQGRHQIEASVPVVIGMASYISDAANFMRPGVNGLHFKGSNITLDFAYTLQFYRENSAGAMLHWLDGCKLINSLGRDSYWRLAYRPIGHTFFEGAWFTETEIDGLHDPCGNTPPLVRGCSFANLARDLTGDALCLVGNTIHEHDSTFFAQDVPAFTLIYAGAEATATIEFSGTNMAASRTFTARWGANSATFTVGNTYALYAANTNYKASHVVNWLNGLGVGFTATLLNDTRCAASGAKLGTQGVAFTAQNVKNTLFTVQSMIDLHSDMYQQNTGSAAIENVIVADNRAWEMVTQNIFLAPASGGTRDWLVINNAIANKLPGAGGYDNTNNYYSQQPTAPQSHVVVVHNTFTNQGWYVNDAAATTDSYCLIGNNTFRQILRTGTPDPDLVIKDNHIHVGKAAAALATGTTIGGDQTSLVASFATGDFTPAGALLSNLKAPLVKYDRRGVARGATAPVGAMAA